MKISIEPGVALDALHRHITEQQAQISDDAGRIFQLRADKDNLVRAAQARVQELETWRERAEHATKELAALRIELTRLRQKAAAGDHTDLTRIRGAIVTKLERHRGTSTMDGHGGYKNPVREGYDKGLTDALALLDGDPDEAGHVTSSSQSHEEAGRAE